MVVGVNVATNYVETCGIVAAEVGVNITTNYIELSKRMNVVVTPDPNPESILLRNKPTLIDAESSSA